MRWFIRILAVAGLFVFILGVALHQRGGIEGLRQRGSSANDSSASIASTQPSPGVAVEDSTDDQEITEPVALQDFLASNPTGSAARDLGLSEVSGDEETVPTSTERPWGDRPQSIRSSSAPPPTEAEDLAAAHAESSPPTIKEAHVPREAPPAAAMSSDVLTQLARSFQRGESLRGMERRVLPGRGPDLLLVIVEDLNREDLGAYGQPLIRTPHFDRLATQGARLTRFAGSAQGHTFERTALWYGGLAEAAPEHASEIIRLAKPSLPENLQKAGYATLLVGNCDWALGEPTAKTEWSHWLGWSESVGAPFASYPTTAPHDGGALDIPSNRESPQARFDRVLLAGATRLLAQAGVGDDSDGTSPTVVAPRKPVALIASVKLSWWQETLEPETRRSVSDWSDLERRHVAAVHALDAWFGELRERLEVNAEKRGVATLVVGLPRRKKAKGLERFRQAVPALDENIPKSAWPYGPVLVAWPGTIPEGHVVDRFSGCQDLLPTLWDMTGGTARPADSGVSHWRAWLGDQRD